MTLGWVIVALVGVIAWLAGFTYSIKAEADGIPEAIGRAFGVAVAVLIVVWLPYSFMGSVVGFDPLGLGLDEPAPADPCNETGDRFTGLAQGC